MKKRSHCITTISAPLYWLCVKAQKIIHNVFPLHIKPVMTERLEVGNQYCCAGGTEQQGTNTQKANMQTEGVTL